MNRYSSFLVKDFLISSLGVGTEVNWEKIKRSETGIEYFPESFGAFPLGHIPQLQSIKKDHASRFENLVHSTLEESKLSKEFCSDPDTIFILSTTKANIELLNSSEKNIESLSIPGIVDSLQKKFGFKNSKIVSNACVSGVMSVILAQRLIEAGKYKHAIILGADVISPFIYSGFQSLNAMSAEVCKPFDITRNGISLGDAGALMVISSIPQDWSLTSKIKFEAGSISNDANHISGPSRTGEPLCDIITSSLIKANVTSNQIDFISAHGTATLYNDEMESKAIHLAGLSQCPLFSLKGNIGHTLGAAGISELIISSRCLIENTLVPSRGFVTSGVSVPIMVSQQLVSRQIKYALKTASGFGGCNASIILKKEEE